jgi:hypothetical protein
MAARLPAPDPLVRHARLEGEELRVPRRVAGPTPHQVIRRAWTLLVIGGGLAIAVGLVQGSPRGGLEVGLVAVAGVVAWLIFGLVGLRLMVGHFGSRVLGADVRGVRWRGRRAAWSEVRAVGVAPYPFTNGSWVYCVELRLTDGSVWRIGGGLPRDRLHWIARWLEGLRQGPSTTAPSEATPSPGDLVALQRLRDRGPG